MYIESHHREPRVAPALWWITRAACAMLLVNGLALFLTPFLIWFASGAWTLLLMYTVGPLVALVGLALAVVQKDRTYRLANLIVVLAYATWWGAMYLMLRPAA
ncbi:MAG TPA: hypothetical protein VFN22_01675 [Gemmatimonadales bacterium]|nr:hypothetical protein [Gemmatimonadales bacterium]